MAYADWIKVEHITPDKQEVHQMAEILGIDPDAVLGKLLRVWIWADQNTVDGQVSVRTLSALDRVAHCTGFGAALLEADWLMLQDKIYVFSNFTRHNSESAKKRAKNNKYQRTSRSKRQDSVSALSDVSSDLLLTASSSSSPSSSESLVKENDGKNSSVQNTYSEEAFRGPASISQSDFDDLIKRHGWPINDFDYPTQRRAVTFMQWYQERRFQQPVTHTEQYRRDLRSVASAIKSFGGDAAWAKLEDYMQHPPENHPVDVKMFQIFATLGLIVSVPQVNSQQQREQSDREAARAILEGKKK